MRTVSVTRLRLRGWFFLPAFLFTNGPIIRQVRAAPGFSGGMLLMDAGRTFWTVSLWKDKSSMLAFRNGGNHGKAMPKLAGWVEHARVANWEQEGESVPDWETLHARLSENGRPTRLSHPSPDHKGATGFPKPRQEGWRMRMLDPLEG
jgi:hypothetical protein